MSCNCCCFDCFFIEPKLLHLLATRICGLWRNQCSGLYRNSYLTEPIAAYLERVAVYFNANEVKEDKQVLVLLSVVGSKVYALLRSLAAPKLPKELSFQELEALLKAHFSPKPLTIAKRLHFHRRGRAAGESIAEYLAELRRLATHCEFADFLDQALHDRLVCGVRSQNVQKLLLSEAKLTLTKAMELAQAMEAAERNAQGLKETEAAVKKLSSSTFKDKGHTSSRQQTQSGASGSQPRTGPCYRCGRTNHDAGKCRFIEAICHACGKIGHIAPVCRSKNRKPSDRLTRSTKCVDLESSNREDDDELQLFTVAGAGSSRAFTVELQVDGKPLVMEIDTGAAFSLISEKSRRSLFPESNLTSLTVVLKTYTEQRMPVLGEMSVQVKYGQQCEELTLSIVAGDGPCLWKRLAAAHKA